MTFWVAGATIGSSLLGASAASSAADTQAAAATRAADLQYKAWQEQKDLQEPFRQGGMAAQNQLMTLLGLSTPGGITRDQARAQLLPQYTTAASGTPGSNALVNPPGYGDDYAGGATGGGNFGSTYSPGGIDEAGLSTAIDQLMANQPTAQGNPNDPQFGSAMRDFGMSDFQQDPGYAFRMSEGLKALDRQAAARGGLISGGALRASQRYGQDMASQEYQNAYNRYQTNRANKLNPLQSMMGAGQTAANTLGTAAGNYAANAGEAYQNVGNARASGYVGTANAINSGLGSYMGYNQGTNLVNALRGSSQPSAGYQTGGVYNNDLVNASTLY